MNRIDYKFKKLKKSGKKALIIYLTCGYPDMKTTERLVLALASSGVDIIELGVPFSDPLADGPVIQEASHCALKKGVNLYKILSLVKSLRKKTDVPICIMTYYNPIFSFGEDKFLSMASKSGVDGVIIPDLPPEEAKELIESGRKNNVATIFFLSPTSSLERIKLVSGLSKGFIYYVSLTGTTGAKSELPTDLKQNISLIKRYAKIPVCVGFGLSKKQHVGKVLDIAEGAIIGSAVIKVIKDNIGKKYLVDNVIKFVRNLR